jgi:hypothetical protein
MAAAASHSRDLTDVQWVRLGLLRSILEVLAQALHDQGYRDLQEALIDGSFAPANQKGARVGKTKRLKGSKIMAIGDRQGLPVAVHVESATPHEVTLVQTTLAQRFVNQLPVRLMGDNAYESDSSVAGSMRWLLLTDEPWGVRRFFVTDPNGTVINVMCHIGGAQAH